MHKEGVFLFFIFSLHVWDVFIDVYCGSGFLLLPLWCPGTEQGRMEPSSEVHIFPLVCLGSCTHQSGKDEAKSKMCGSEGPGSGRECWEGRGLL